MLYYGGVIMPLYEYQCKKCEKKFEILISASKANGAQECPECGSKETNRLLSSFCASVGTSKNSTGNSCSLKGG
jgi:putative FmdB family regulatory protein